MEHRVNAMEQQTYKADAEIYEVLEREIIDLTIRPGSLLSENPLCARFGAPRSLIRVGKMYLWRTLQSAHADYSRFRMLDTMTSGGLAEVIADHTNLIEAIERCDLAAFEPLVERHLYGGIRRLGSKLTEEYADYFEPEK